MSDLRSNTCAVCPRAIGISYLMCPPHWHLVKRDLKQEVFRAWGAMQRGGGSPMAQMNRVREYRAARDRAVAAAREHIKHQPKGT